jgi:hypothetical protein
LIAMTALKDTRYIIEKLEFLKQPAINHSLIRAWSAVEHAPA